MSSLEIAELVESRHDKVKQSIERLADRDVIQLPPMGEVYNKQSLSPNSKAKAYIFSGEQGRRDSIIVVAQLCPEFTARLVDRWQELEEQQRPDPMAVLNAPSATHGLLCFFVCKNLLFSRRPSRKRQISVDAICVFIALHLSFFAF